MRHVALRYALCLCMTLATPAAQANDTTSITEDQLSWHDHISLQKYGKTGIILGLTSWMISQLSRMPPFNLYAAEMINLAAHESFCIFETQEEQEQAHKLVNMVNTITQQHNYTNTPSVTALTPETRDAFFQWLNTQHPDQIWILYDKNYQIHSNGTPIKVWGNNAIVLTPQILELPHDQQLAILRHEHSHIINNDMSHIYRSAAIRLLTISATQGLIWYSSYPGWQKALGIAMSSAAIQYTLYYTLAWQEIRSDLAAADAYQDVYDGLEYINPHKHQTNTQKLLMYLFDPHQTNETRYAYMKSYYETGHLPWYIKIRPAYWLGQPLEAVENAATRLDSPTDNLISHIQSGYTAATSWLTNNDEGTAQKPDATT